MSYRLNRMGPASQSAGVELASRHFGVRRDRVQAIASEAIIAALALLAIDLMRACLAARRQEVRQAAYRPTPIELAIQARRLRSARWWNPLTWSDLQIRRRLETVASRTAVPELHRAGARISASSAVDLALDATGDVPFVDLDLLIREADGEGPSEDDDEDDDPGPDPPDAFPWGRALLVALVVFGGRPGMAQEARLEGPSRPVELGSPVLIDATGSEAPGGFDWMARGPDGATLAVVPLYTDGGGLAFAVLRPRVPGRHLVVLVATGPDPPDGSRPNRAIDFVEVVASDPEDQEPGRPGPPGPRPPSWPDDDDDDHAPPPPTPSPQDPMASAVRLAIGQIEAADRLAVIDAILVEARTVQSALASEHLPPGLSAELIATRAVTRNGDLGRRYAWVFEDLASTVVAAAPGSSELERINRLIALLEESRRG